MVEADHLVRRVSLPDGEGYEIRCHRRDYLAIARAVAASAGPFVRDGLSRAAGVSRAPALVAMMFLKAQELVTNQARRFHAATSRFSVEAALAAYGALEGDAAARLAA